MKTIDLRAGLLAAVLTAVPVLSVSTEAGAAVEDPVLDKIGVVLYKGATENEGFVIKYASSQNIEVVEPEKEGIVEVEFIERKGSDDYYKLTPVGAGETRIHVMYKRQGTNEDHFYLGVKVVDPSAGSAKMFVRMKNGETISGNTKCMIAYLEGEDINNFYGYDCYAVLAEKSDGTTLVMDETRSIFGDGELLWAVNTPEQVSYGYESPSLVPLNVRQIDNMNKYSLYSADGNKYLGFTRSDKTKLQMSESETDKYVSISIDEDNLAQIHFIDDTEPARVIKFQQAKNGTKAFRNSKTSTGANGIYALVELYVEKEVEFTKPEVSAVKVMVDGTQVTGENIYVSEGEHILTFEGIPEGDKLYYTLGGATEIDPQDEAPVAPNRYEGNDIKITGTSGTLEYYVESKGMQSDKAKKTISISTGLDNINIEGEFLYYDMNGVRTESPKQGIYIKKSGNKAEKVVK